MEELKNLMLEFFSHDKRFHSKDELRKFLKIKGEEQTTIFNNALIGLVEDGCLFFDEKKGYTYFSNDMGLAVGEIEINKSGTGFVHTNNGYTILIENNDLKGALNGDTVIVNSINSNRKDFYSGEIYKVIKRKKGEVIFETIVSGNSISLVPYNKNENINVTVNNNELKDLVDGQLVLISVGTTLDENSYLAEIKKVIGHKNDPDIDIQLLAAKYNIPINFSKEALKELESIPNEVSSEDIINRIDLREKNIVTIDCDDTKDRDDAVLVEKLENGNYRLITNISAINYYVKKGMKLYDEAIERSTSHYLNDTCIPLFPPKLSNGICSLNPNVDRLTRTIETEISPDGKIVDINIYRSVINSKKAMAYSDVNKVLDGITVDGYQSFEENLKLMKELSDIYDQVRFKRNCIDFDLPDIKVVKNNDGYMGFKNTGIGKAERIIENFMLISGYAWTIYYNWMLIIYRIHEMPDKDVVNDTLELLRKSGLRIPKLNNINGKSLANFLSKINELDEADIIKTYLLMSMKRAKYDIDNIGHFALQTEAHSQVTSPIRRIGDFINHSITDDIENLDFSEEGIKNLTNELREICNHATKMEKKADDLEEEARTMAMAEYIEKHIGEEFKAQIIKIYKNGMFVKTDNLITGKIKISDILDDKYYFDYDKQAIIGKRTKRKYQIGNKVYVIAKNASKANLSIEFEISNNKVKKLEK